MALTEICLPLLRTDIEHTLPKDLTVWEPIDLGPGESPSSYRLEL